ncbi:hypothetical protein EV361DRAFT_779097, partial [Lentinula raphanica]
MVEVCEERKDREGLRFWQWVVLLLGRAGHEFMSDEEDMWCLDPSGSSSRRVPKAAKQVLHLRWRNDYFTKLFTFMEVTTGVEEMVFHHAGR